VSISLRACRINRYQVDDRRTKLCLGGLHIKDLSSAWVVVTLRTIT